MVVITDTENRESLFFIAGYREYNSKCWEGPATDFIISPFDDTAKNVQALKENKKNSLAILTADRYSELLKAEKSLETIREILYG